MTTVRDARRPTLPARQPKAPPPAERRPFRDNPRLILLGIVLLFGALAAMIVLADQSAELNPDFLSEVVLYALSAADLTMVLALVFVLARNVVKLLVERRRGLPFSRFRAKLVLAMLGLTIIPSVLVLIVGGELIRSSTERWFSQPIDDVLRSANEIAVDYYRDRETVVANHAERIARVVPAARRRGGRHRCRAERARARSDAGAGRPRRGLSDPGGLAADSARRRRVAVAAAGHVARVGRSAGGAGRQRQPGSAGARAARRRRRAGARRRRPA